MTKKKVPPKTMTACVSDGCAAPALSHRVVSEKLPGVPVGGMCTLHTIRAAVRLKAATLPKVAKEYHDAAPYMTWVNEVVASGTVRYQGVTLNNVTYADLCELTGVHRVTFSRLHNGHLSKVRRPVVMKLQPFVLLTDTKPAWRWEVGKVYLQGDLAYAPLLTTVLDSRRRAWQLRGNADSPIWSPAHTVDTRPSRQQGTPHAAAIDSPAWPVKMLYLPPHCAIYFHSIIRIYLP